MGSHPLNLIVRFLLEIIALGIMGAWAFQYGNGWMKYAFVIGIIIVVAAIWGTFAVPNDPSRSGSAPIVVPGVVRLFIELIIFTIAAWALHSMGYYQPSWLFTVIVVLHYIVSYDRVIWLLKNS